MTMKTRAIWIVIIAGLIYAGVKGFIYFKVKRQVDTLASAVAPFVDIQYGSIASSFDGTVSIGDISVRPSAIGDTVKIKQLSLSTPGLGFLLSGADSMRKGELPERFGLKLQGISLSLNGGLITMLESAEAKDTTSRPSIYPICVSDSSSLIAQYRELEMKDAIFDVAFAIARGSQPTDLKVDMSYVMQDVEQWDLAITLSDLGQSVASVAMQTPKLKDMRVSFKPNPDYVKRLLEYCARQHETDVAAFIDQFVEQDDSYFADETGFVPGPGLRMAMKEMLQNPGELRIMADPLEPLDINTMALYSPDDWPSLLGLSVLVNDTAVTDLRFQLASRVPKRASLTESMFGAADQAPLPEEAYEAVPETAMEGKPVVEDDGDAALIASAPERQPASMTGDGYRAVAIKDIPKLVGKEVRIVTTDGMNRSGQVLKVENNEIYLERRYGGGSFATQVPVVTVQQIEVLE